MRKLVCAALALISWNASAASIELGRFSYVEAQMESPYRIYEHHAPITLTLKVSFIHPVSMGMPMSYLHAQLNSLQDCQIEVRVTLINGQVASDKPATLICAYNHAYDYVGSAPVQI